jgi:hypothetical protein
MQRPLLHNYPDKIRKLAIIPNKGIINRKYSVKFAVEN